MGGGWLSLKISRQHLRKKLVARAFCLKQQTLVSICVNYNYMWKCSYHNHEKSLLFCIKLVNIKIVAKKASLE